MNIVDEYLSELHDLGLDDLHTETLWIGWLLIAAWIVSFVGLVTA